MILGGLTANLPRRRDDCGIVAKSPTGEKPTRNGKIRCALSEPSGRADPIWHRGASRAKSVPSL